MEITISITRRCSRMFCMANNGENFEREVLEATALEGYRSKANFHTLKLEECLIWRLF